MKGLECLKIETDNERLQYYNDQDIIVLDEEATDEFIEEINYILKELPKIKSLINIFRIAFIELFLQGSQDYQYNFNITEEYQYLFPRLGYNCDQVINPIALNVIQIIDAGYNRTQMFGDVLITECTKHKYPTIKILEEIK